MTLAFSFSVLFSFFWRRRGAKFVAISRVRSFVESQLAEPFREVHPFGPPHLVAALQLSGFCVERRSTKKPGTIPMSGFRC